MAIIGIAGAKQSGKSSAAKLITGLVMKKLDIIDSYDMNSEGKLIVPYEINDGKAIKRDMGIFDLDRRDEAFGVYLYERIWPHVKIYNFADSLKYLLANMFGVDLDKMFGTSEDKEASSNITWGQMVDIIPKKKLKKNIRLDELMTNREVMQHFGDVLRNINDNCFINYLLKEIEREQCPVSLIADVRREAEIDAINAVGGRIIYLTRVTDNKETHDTENVLQNVDTTKFDIIIDNQNMSIQEKNISLVNELKDRGFLQ